MPASWRWVVAVVVLTAFVVVVRVLTWLAARSVFPHLFTVIIIAATEIALAPLQVSSDRYGTIGVAFTYIGWLYVLAFCLLTAAVVGQAIVQDEGAAGRFIRGTAQAAGEPP